ncbi:hypothetical protein AUJ69_01980 [Candidatus Woesearchaeota archaeon CG1_02_47_18]|nr:MAG: hypothetical protein AUJ69_01980 [Candidatus Woesearchaeota archaeon CG1_02_47_18]
MVFNRYIFREYDIRGRYPDDIDEEITKKIAIGFASILPDAKSLVAAMDGRLSSPGLKRAFIDGVTSCGRDVIDVGLVPIPLFYFAIMHHRLDGGFMISGSHNPKEYNGIKLQREQCIPIDGNSGVYQIRDMIEGSQLKAADEGGKRGRVSRLDVLNEYLNFVAAKIKLKRGLKVVIDSGNGACGLIPEMIFKMLGCSVKTLYGDIDGNFPNHLPDPHETESLKELQKAVVDEGADCGFAFDGDGDRVGLIDEKGCVVSGDFIIMMLARDLLSRKKGNVIVDIRGSKAYIEDITAHGGRGIISKAGRTNIMESIRRENAVFGGELTGHIFFPVDYYNYDDGIFVALKLAEVISGIRSLSRYVASLPRYNASPEFFIDCPDDVKFKKVEEFRELLKKRGYNFLDVGDIRINIGKGWALVRASNTTPYIKCRFEGTTAEELEHIKKIALGLLSETGVDIHNARTTA